MSRHIFTLWFTIFGMVGLAVLALLAISVFWYFRGCRERSFRWQTRNHYIKQISALVCMFCLAMAASYGLLAEAWALFYLVLACKAGTWWLRMRIDQQA
ncbi:hypothetical protein ccbrp13_68690 [Ktedonobacteria bacterium brp13]|nr:hypothetical protein ccbrp13_68690 [Ktedonobacteria bacterium brp13]